MGIEHAAPGPLRSGDSAADREEPDWNAVYRDQLPRLYNYVRFRLGGDVDAEDVTARTFEKAWQARARYRSDVAGFSAWLFGIARHVIADHVRARRSHLPLEAAQEVALGGTPEEEVAHGSNLARLARLTGNLPQRERELIALKYGAELNNRMIARLTGLSESNVGTILHRVVQRLREQW